MSAKIITTSTPWGDVEKFVLDACTIPDDEDVSRAFQSIYERMTIDAVARYAEVFGRYDSEDAARQLAAAVMPDAARRCENVRGYAIALMRGRNIGGMTCDQIVKACKQIEARIRGRRKR